MSNEDVTSVPPGFGSPAPERTVGERLAEKRAAKAKRDAEAEKERDASELERLELEERFEKELNGKRGRAFMIVDASDLGEGCIVLKLGEDVLWNTFSKSKMNVVDTDAFVVPCVVYPSVDQYRGITKRRAFIADRCASALATLYGVKADVEAGK